LRYTMPEALAAVDQFEMLRRMLRIRIFEERVSELIYDGQIPLGGHLAIGQEAEIVGACMALRRDDYMTGNHRSHGHPIGKGAALPPLMAELLGRRTGVCRGKGGSMHLAVFSEGSLGESGIVGSLMPVAVGAGLSARLRHTDQVCLSFFGDGAANCGPFHESLNLASIWKLPVIFLCENNGYAMFTPQRQTTTVKDVAQRACAYNIPGVVVDGQNIVEVYGAVSAAVARARSGEGPTLVEAKTYRYGEHAEYRGSRLPPYRSEEEMQAWRARDPIKLFARHLQGLGVVTEQEFARIRAEVESEVAAAVVFAQESPVPESSELFDDLLL
jgi:acetoin:2,6-dichlorophenolindophenol oxidoreductase subunit alpha